VRTLSGTIEWQRGWPSSQGYTQRSPFADGGSRVVLTPLNNNLVEVEASTGEVVWTATGAAGALVQPFVPPGVGSRVLSSVGTAVIALDSEGAIEWSTEAAASMLAPVGGGVVVAVSLGEPPDDLVALDERTGTVQWRLPPTPFAGTRTPTFVVPLPADAAGDRAAVVVESAVQGSFETGVPPGTGLVRVVDTETGAVLDRQALDINVVQATTTDDGTIVLVGRDGTVQTYRFT
jgi:outer membrane protein assembly factor BamB